MPTVVAKLMLRESISQVEAEAKARKYKLRHTEPCAVTVSRQAEKMQRDQEKLAKRAAAAAEKA